MREPRQHRAGAGTCSGRTGMTGAENRELGTFTLFAAFAVQIEN